MEKKGAIFAKLELAREAAAKFQASDIRGPAAAAAIINRGL